MLAGVTSNARAMAICDAGSIRERVDVARLPWPDTDLGTPVTKPVVHNIGGRKNEMQGEMSSCDTNSSYANRLTIASGNFGSDDIMTFATTANRPTVPLMPSPAVRRGLLQLVPTLTLIALLWSASSWGYYALVDTSGVANGYDDAPILFAGYYVLWTLAAIAALRRPLAAGLTRSNVAAQARGLVPILFAYGVFAALVLPILPNVSVIRAPSDAPEFMFASAWYYLPKSADILFQQVLVAAMIRRADAAGLSLRAIALLLAVLFGGFHLTLALDGALPLYVARFTIAATLFGLLVPYLYLRARHGFRWAYGLHWGFYAVDATVTHFVLAAPPWA